MQIWESIQEIPLVVMGGGPLEEEFRTWAEKKDNVYFLGYMQHEECLGVVKKAEFVIFPSIWYEGCSMVEIETQSIGKGIIATDLGFSEEVIKNGINGFKVPLGNTDGFVEAIRKLWENPEQIAVIGKNARMDYEEKYQPDDNYRQMMLIYRDAMKGNKK